MSCENIQEKKRKKEGQNGRGDGGPLLACLAAYKGGAGRPYMYGTYVEREERRKKKGRRRERR